jgi:two-component system, LuxR family, response regulator FixJ
MRYEELQVDWSGSTFADAGDSGDGNEPRPLMPVHPTILVVDDDEAIRVSLRNLMESEGFAVHAFANGQDLLNEASLPAIGCLVVDYHMPAMNGLELVSALRGRGVSIPAILFTGNPTKHVRDRAAAMAALVVEKSGQEIYLLDCVREAVAKHAKLLSLASYP